MEFTITYNADSSVPVHGNLVHVQDAVEATMSHELYDDDTLRVTGADRGSQELDNEGTLKTAGWRR